MLAQHNYAVSQRTHIKNTLGWQPEQAKDPTVEGMTHWEMM